MISEQETDKIPGRNKIYENVSIKWMDWHIICHDIFQQEEGTILLAKTL